MQCSLSQYYIVFKYCFPNHWEKIKINQIFVLKVNKMIELLNKVDNIQLVQEFIDEAKERISNGVDITFQKKLMLN